MRLEHRCDRATHGAMTTCTGAVGAASENCRRAEHRIATRASTFNVRPTIPTCGPKISVQLLEIRWSFRYEMRHLFALAGFVVEEELSDYLGAPPAYGKEQISVARKG